MKTMIRIALLAALAAMTPLTHAADATDKPFAEKHVVLQISDGDPAKQTLVLNVANNLIQHYGQDKIDVEIVAFGPGLPIMFAKNDNTKRISGLVSSGVQFSACGNTIKGITKKTGHAPDINPEAKVVPAGIVRILDLIDKGYVLVRP
jgi:intracellular sulfur oxidation DsrE/DsrF family protein